MELIGIILKKLHKIFQDVDTYSDFNAALF